MANLHFVNAGCRRADASANWTVLRVASPIFPSSSSGITCPRTCNYGPDLIGGLRSVARSRNDLRSRVTKCGERSIIKGVR